MGWGEEPSFKNDRTDTADNHAVDIVADQSMSSETPEPSMLLGGKAHIRSKRLTVILAKEGGRGSGWRTPGSCVGKTKKNWLRRNTHTHKHIIYI